MPQAPNAPPAQRKAATPRPTAVAALPTAAATPHPKAPSAASAKPSDPLLRDAQATVRTYIGALIAGDEGTARAQLLANAGTASAALSEKSFLDSGARILDLSANATSPTTATVDVDIRSSSGLYYVHYELRRLDSGVTLIQEHNYAKT